MPGTYPHPSASNQAIKANKERDKNTAITGHETSPLSSYYRSLPDRPCQKFTTQSALPWSRSFVQSSPFNPREGTHMYTWDQILNHSSLHKDQEMGEKILKIGMFWSIKDSQDIFSSFHAKQSLSTNLRIVSSLTPAGSSLSVDFMGLFTFTSTRCNEFVKNISDKHLHIFSLSSYRPIRTGNNTL